jgi:hypothetical protein
VTGYYDESSLEKERGQNSVGSGLGPRARSRKQGTEPLGFIKDVELNV